MSTTTTPRRFNITDALRRDTIRAAIGIQLAERPVTSRNIANKLGLPPGPQRQACVQFVHTLARQSYFVRHPHTGGVGGYSHAEFNIPDPHALMQRYGVDDSTLLTAAASGSNGTGPHDDELEGDDVHTARLLGVLEGAIGSAQRALDAARAALVELQVAE